MACRFLDSFDYYSTADLTRKWTNAGSFATIQNSVVRNGINALRIQDNTTTGYVSNTLDNQASWVVGFAFRIADVGASDRKFHLQFIDSGTVQCSLALNLDGTLEVFRANNTAVTDGKSSLALSPDTWYHVEIKVTIANSIGAGTCVVKVNGVTWITVATGQDLQQGSNAFASVIKFFNETSGPSLLYIDDVHIFDGTGSDNNDLAGDSKVVALHPDGNGTTSDFDGSDGNQVNNFEQVDETDTDDAAYNESSTVGHIDLYTFDDLAETPSAIHAVQVNMVVTKDDSGSRTMRTVTRPTSVNKFGDSESPSESSFINFRKVYDLDPQAASAWTESTLNATEFGVEIET